MLMSTEHHVHRQIPARYGSPADIFTRKCAGKIATEDLNLPPDFCVQNSLNY